MPIFGAQATATIANMEADDITLEAMQLGHSGADVQELAIFLASNPFPYQLRPEYTAEQAREIAASDRWQNDSARTYRIRAAGEAVGILLCEDLHDPTIIIDIRIAASHRGKGIGAQTLRECVPLLFTAHPQARRIEGQTRHDNIPMQRAFEKAGWIREAYLRDGWDDGYDTVGYAITRRDWKARSK